MDAFERARAKYEKNRERQSRVPQVQITEKREAPKEVKEQKKDGPMVLAISGPVSMVLEIDYAGTLLSSQLTPQALTETLKKALSVLGRVRCP